MNPHEADRRWQFATPDAMAEWAGRPVSAIHRRILEWAEFDWLQIVDVISVLKEHGVAEDEILAQGIDAVATLLVRGDIVAGQIRDDGFVPTTAPVQALVEQIAQTWTKLGALGPKFGDICWFDITEQGRTRLNP